MTFADVMKDLVFPSLLIVFGAVFNDRYKWWQDRQEDRKAQSEQLYKLVYVKAHHLTDRASGRPVYKAKLPSTGEGVDVYDEFDSFEVNVFRRARSDFRWFTRSSGSADCRILYPWSQLANNDRQDTPGDISGTVAAKSTTFCARSTRYNGFQKGNTDQGMMIEKLTTDARLVVDFSSLPGFDSKTFFSDSPKANQVFDNGKGLEAVDVSEPSPGVFIAYCNNIAEGRVIRMDFSLNWTAIGQAQGLPGGH